MFTVLIIEDDVQLAHSIWQLLKDEYDVTVSNTAQAAYTQLSKHHFDLIITDRMLGHHDGLDIIEYVRATYLDTRVICISQLNTAGQRIRGLEFGADDYLSKPFSFRELQLKVRTFSRFNRALPKKTYQLGGLHYNVEMGVLKDEQQSISLTKKENELLYLFVRYKNQVLSRKMIVETIWDEVSTPDESAVDVHVGRLRTKLSTHSHYIKTKRGFGYALQL